MPSSSDVTTTTQEHPGFTAGWLFGGRYAPGSESAGYDDRLFAPITVPHCVTPLSWNRWDPAAWDGEWIYRRHVELHPDARSERLFLEFEGVLTGATVVVNDVSLGKHVGGYLPFAHEITDLVHDGDNVIAVVVDGSWQWVPPDGSPAGPAAVDYCQPAGIYREVRLLTVPRCFIADVFAKPVDVLGPAPAVETMITVDLGEVATCELTIEVRDGERVMASATVPAGAADPATPGRVTARARLGDLGPIGLWSVTDPRLYQVITRLSVDGVEVHRENTRIGFREARWESDGFYLNGERLHIFGLNRHQIFPYVGHAMPARVQRRDAAILRTELHCNMVRCAHYPPSRHFLDACDELGLLVWEEPPGWQFLPDDPSWLGLALRDVREMVRRDRNRPSVVLWAGRLNETRNLPDFYRQTKAAINELDGSRQTTGAMIYHSTDDWVQDVFGFDDYAGDRTNAFLRPPLDPPYLVSECVGALSSQPFYRWTDKPGSLALQATAHAQVHDTARSDNGYAGVLGWVAFDYGSQHGNVHNNVKTPGVADGFREFKYGALFYRSQVEPAVEAVIEPAFSWGFGPLLPPQGPGQRALILSNCERLELYVGDEHVASAMPDRQGYPHLPYPPFFVNLRCDPVSRPELRIDGYVGAELVATRRMAADPQGDRLELTADDDVLDADGSDMTRLVIRTVDRYGNRRPLTGSVGFTVQGPGLIVGDDPFELEETPGGGAVWLRATVEPGTVVVTASHAALGEATTQVATRAGSGHR